MRSRLRMLASICTIFKPKTPSHSRTMSTRSYQDAIEALNSLQSNAATLEALRASGARNSEHTIPEMVEYLGRIGYTPSDLNKLNVIHITGTKGKGSTCAFTDSILRQAAPGWKVGLYTSPHLVAVRERIRLNGVPMSEEDFAKYFFEVWDRLEKNDVRANPETTPKPMYFRYLTLVAFHYFASINVDATILEVGVGGAYDCTNIVPKPIVTGISSLGLDHTAVLGKTVAEIAWQKGGIYKRDVPAFTVEQVPEAMDVLEQRATERQSSTFTVVPTLPELDQLKLGLSGSHQRQNASLAAHVAHQFLLAKQERVPSNLPPSLYPTPLTKEATKGLEITSWPGRCQKVDDPLQGNLTWFLDGAHTVESLKFCAEWFFNRDTAFRETIVRPQRVLIFNCTRGRSGSTFLGTILNGLKTQLELLRPENEKDEQSGFFDHVMFCTNATYADGNSKGDLTVKGVDSEEIARLGTQTELRDVWKSLVPSFPPADIHVLPSIEHAVTIIRGLYSNHKAIDILVAGSLHLVGGVIEVAGLEKVALAT